ncbi:LexA family transcriptional regulator [Paenisporosarcina sp. OV554]|uniref:LexA family protein n=1 Tax=Paenisporosarcina sp. OV554 TaxID=2135694 RepID=UPI000D3A3EEF|nr:XRE family transcriptional regulator [Paenisporosarcina sp. OV554]PUB12585.1 repressor LexA [Paenisporosarcina sp. OV554]
MTNAQDLKNIMAKNLKYYIDKKGLNQTDIAQILDIPEMTMSNWMKAKTYPRIDKIQLLADYFHILRSDLTEEKPTNLIEVSSQTKRIPILGIIACGDPILAEENVEGYMYESSDNLPSGNLFGLIVKGSSMEPTIPNGSKVLIREQSEVETGEIAAVLVNGNTEATLKRIKKQGDLIILMPDNASHEPYIVTESNPARIIGKAIRFTRDL